MRKTLTLVGLLMGVLFVAGLVKAQFAPVFSEVRVTVPFVFTAGDTPMAPGDYVIKRVNEMEPRMLTLSTADGSFTMFLMVHLSDTNAVPKTSEVWFNKYGNQYFLSQFTIEGYSNRQQLGRSNAEKRAAAGGELLTEVRLPAREN